MHIADALSRAHLNLTEDNNSDDVIWQLTL